MDIIHHLARTAIEFDESNDCKTSYVIKNKRSNKEIRLIINDYFILNQTRTTTVKMNNTVLCHFVNFFSLVFCCINLANILTVDIDKKRFEFFAKLL